MVVCLVSCPVTRNTSGLPAKVTSLPSPGIRITAFALILGLHGLPLRHARQLLRHWASLALLDPSLDSPLHSLWHLVDKPHPAVCPRSDQSRQRSIWSE